MADEKESATAVVKSEKPDEDLPFENDGNFMKHYLSSQKNVKTEAGETTIEETKRKPGPALKKSRFTSMLNQMKRTRAGVGALPTTKKTSGFYNDSSSDSEDEGKPKIKTLKTTVNITNSANTLHLNIPANSGTSNTNSSPVCVKVENNNNNNTEKGCGSSQAKPRKKKSRWGEKIDLAEVAPPGVATIPGMPVMNNPVIVPQVYQVPGCSQLTPAQQKQLKEQKEMQAMYNLIMASRNAQAAVMNTTRTNTKKNKREYDSDEEIDEDLGTWEHQNRRLEMKKTQELAEKLTGESEGKHFIGDFLPPDELQRFMETFQALKEGRTPDFSDYKDFKLQCDNLGFKMLEKMGWSEGQGLGSDQQGITAPVNQGKQSIDGRGVGVDKPDTLNKDDDEFSAYRKRMMLAYRFRPNPLNNPRRPYY